MFRYRVVALQAALLLLSISLIHDTLAQRPIYGASWGSNLDGRLGIGQTNARKAGTMMATNAASAARPTADLNIKRIVAGSDFAIAVTASNEILTWGSNSHCQLNQGSCSGGGAGINEPGWMNTLPTGDPYYAITDIMAAGSTAYALVQTSSSNILYSWGRVSNKAGTVSMMPQYALSAGSMMAPSAVGPSGLGQQPWSDVLGATCSGSLCFARTGHGLYGWGDGYASPPVFPCASPTDGVCRFDSQPAFSSLLGSASVVDACVATETDASGAKLGARMVLMTDDARLLIAGSGMQFSPVSNIGWTGVSGASLHSACASSISEVRCSNAAVFVRCGNTVVSFGKNDDEVLGTTGSASVSYTAPFVVPLPSLAGGQNLHRMAAGRNSVFIVTTQGRDPIGWGSADDCGMAANCSPQAKAPHFINLNGAVFKGSQYYPIDVTATPESTGGFLRLAPGPIGACPPVPTTLMQQFYCDTGNVYTFLKALVFSGTYDMPSGVQMQGDMTLLGSSLLDAPYSLSIKGNMRTRGRAGAKFRGNLQVTDGSLILEQNSFVQVDAGASLSITNGEITMTDDSTLLITASNFEAGTKKSSTAETATTPIITATGQALLTGNVTIVVPEAVVLQLLQTGQNGLVQDASMRSTIVQASVVDSKTFIPTIVLLKPTYSTCQKPVGTTSKPTPTTLMTVITLDSSECTTTPPPTPTPTPRPPTPTPVTNPTPAPATTPVMNPTPAPITTPAPVNPPVPSSSPVSPSPPSSPTTPSSPTSPITTSPSSPVTTSPSSPITTSPSSPVNPPSPVASEPVSNSQSETPTGKKMSTTTLYIIIFSIVGACIIAAVIAGIVVLKCDSVKRTVLPYRE